MKKILLLTALLLSSFFATKAQQVALDVRLGGNVSGIENSNSKMKLGLKAGAGVDIFLSEAFSVRPMLFYTSKGVSEGKNNLGFSPDQTTSLNYLQIPVLASYHIKLNNKMSIVANAGPYAAYRVNTPTKNTEWEFKKFDAGVNAGLDFVIKKMVIGVDAEYGFTSVSSNVDKLHNINYSLMVGYKF